MAEVILVSGYKNENNFDEVVTTAGALSAIPPKIEKILPSNAKITKVEYKVKAKFQHETLAGVGMQMYFSARFCNTDVASGLDIIQKTKMTDGTATEYTADLTKYFNEYSPFSIKNTSYSNFVYYYMETANLFKRSHYVEYAKLVITYEIPTYTITWANIDGNGKTTTTTVNRGTVPTYSGTPTKASTAQYTYAFSGWSPSPVAATGNATYTAQFTATLRKYAVTFKDENGTTLKTETVAYGGKPTPPTAPVKPDTAQHKYTFDGWYDSNGNKWTSSTTITGATTFTARYTSTVQKYTVKWYNYDGSFLETDTDVPYGTKPTYNGATPTKPSDDYYNYGFAGWSPSVDGIIEGDKDFTAQFAQTDRYYTVRWLNASAEEGVEGELLETDEVLFNTQPDYNGTEPVHPLQDTDPEFDYTFIGWAVNVNDPAKPDTELETVKGNITYTAIYEKTKKLYLITIRQIFDSEIREEDTQLLEYGTTLCITLLDVVDGYRFKGWSDGVAGSEREIFVIGETTYVAIYEKIPPPEITSVQMLYSNKQISAANKVPAGEFFRIVVGAVAYDS